MPRRPYSARELQAQIIKDHSETTFPNSHNVIARNFVGIPRDKVKAIVGDKARAPYQVGRA